MTDPRWLTQPLQCCHQLSLKFTALMSQFSWAVTSERPKKGDQLTLTQPVSIIAKRLKGPFSSFSLARENESIESRSQAGPQSNLSARRPHSVVQAAGRPLCSTYLLTGYELRGAAVPGQAPGQWRMRTIIVRISDNGHCGRAGHGSSLMAALEG